MFPTKTTAEQTVTKTTRLVTESTGDKEVVSAEIKKERALSLIDDALRVVLEDGLKSS